MMAMLRQSTVNIFEGFSTEIFLGWREWRTVVAAVTEGGLSY